MSKKNKSDEIRSTDGRKYNKRLPSKVKLKQEITSKPPAMNQAKKDRVGKFAVNAIKKVYGSEAGENAGEVAPRRTNAPVINFFNTELPQGNKEDDTIDIEAEEIDDIQDIEIDEDTDSSTS
jgi:hypothetical protein